MGNYISAQSLRERRHPRYVIPSKFKKLVSTNKRGGKFFVVTFAYDHKQKINDYVWNYWSERRAVDIKGYFTTTYSGTRRICLTDFEDVLFFQMMMHECIEKCSEHDIANTSLGPYVM